MTSRRRYAAAAVLAGCLLLAGCGTEASPAEQVPKIADALTAVDEALLDGEPRQARRALGRLITATQDARDAGDLGEAEADRILAAAATLLAVVPDKTPQPAPAPEPPAPSPAPEQSEEEAPVDEGEADGEDAEEKEKDREKEREEQEKEREEREKEQGKDDKGEGNDKGKD